MPASSASGRPDSTTDDEAPQRPTLGPGPDSELTWLLHRAAQRMHALVGAEAERHGLSLRDHIVLSALHKTADLTQVELGQALGMDKTTLTAEIDRLERMELVSRRVNPRDRRARIVAITPKGDAARAAIAARANAREAEAVGSIPAAEVAQLRRALYSIIGSAEDPGSCI